MSTPNNDNFDFCNDPDAVVAEATLKDILNPCSQVALAVPLFIVTQLAINIGISYLKEWWMRRSGVEEADIQMILSSRRNPVCQDGKVGDKEEQSNSTDDAVESGQIEKDGIADEEIATTKANQGPTEDTSPPTSTNDQPMNPDKSTDELQVPQVDDSCPTSIPPPPINEATGVRQFDLQYLLQVYGDKKLRVFDSVTRKTAHFLSGFSQMIQLQLVSNTYVAYGQAGFLAAAVNSVILATCCYVFPDSWLTTRLFGGIARIRDGKFGRVNFLTACYGFAFGTLVNYILGAVSIIPQLQDSSFQMLMPPLAYASLVVGDALGELIGGPFGGTFFPTFQVKGMGEINRKSVEGCTAVFAGSFAGSCAICVLHGATSPSWMLLCLCLAMVSTIVETISFRSTDNFFIPLGNTLVLMLTFGAFGDHFN